MFYPNFAETNVLTMVRNGLIEALNQRMRFPSAVVILTSDQLIVEDPLYLPSEIDRKIKWILREIDAAVKIRKSLLPSKSYTLGEPRIMWVRAFQNTRANNVPTDMMLKFNNMLRRICMAKAVYTIPVNDYDDSTVRCFDFDGKTKVNGGFELLWIDIIKGIKKHDQSDKYAEIATIVKEHSKDYTCSQCKYDQISGSNRDFKRSSTSYPGRHNRRDCYSRSRSRHDAQDLHRSDACSLHRSESARRSRKDY